MSLFTILFALPVFVFAGIPTISSLDMQKITYGKSSETIRQFQRTMNNMGYLIAETGPGSAGQETTKFDDKVREAIRVYQVENGLTVTGKLDSTTVKSLNKMITFLNENGFEDELPLSTTTTTISAEDFYKETLGSDYFDGMNKDFFEGEKDSVLTYVGSAVKLYTGVDISHTFPRSTDSTTLFVEQDSFQSEKVTQIMPRTGNMFQDVILKSLVGQATNYFYQTAKKFSSTQLDQIPTPFTSIAEIAREEALKGGYTTEEIEKSKQSVMTDGKFDIFKCLQDPICSSI